MDGLQKVIIPMTLDLLRRSNQQIAVVNVGEAASRQLEIALTRGRIPFIPGDELSVTVYALKPDGNKVFAPCEISGNIVRMNITTQMTAASGVIKCNLRIGTAESVLFSSMFYLESYDTVFSDAAVESTDEFTALSQALRYQHIRYAPKKPTANSDMTEDPDDLTAYIGVAVTLSPEAPHDYTKYKWCSYRGKPGAIFTPHVSEDGILSWTNDQNLDNPTPVNIKGPTGDIGPTGPTGAQGETGPAGIVISETEPTDESHPVWIRPSGEYIVENLGISGATVGQVPAVKAVDENGVLTEWEAADGDGDSKPFVVTVTYGDNGTLTADKTHAEIVAAYAAGAQINAKIVNYPGVNAPCILPLYVNNSDLVFIFSGSGVLDGRAMAMTAQDFNGSWSVSLTELATPDDIPSGGTDTSLGVTGAEVGQIIKIKAVDENGIPTEWEAADMASGGDGWTEIGELTVEGTKFIISDYTDGVITVTPDNGIYPSVGRSYVIRKPDYSAYINARIVATETEGKFTLVNLDNGAYTPSEDLTQYVIDAPDAWGDLVFSNLSSFSYLKIGITTPLLSSHGLRSTIGISGKIQFSIGASCSNLTGGAVEAIIETDESPVSGKDYVKASFKGKSPNRSNGYDVIDFVNKSTSDIIKIGHYNGLMVSGTNVKLWGRS